jgi:hypothetical protein
MDLGATAPSSGWVIGQAQTSAAANATFSVALSQGYNASSGGGGTPGGSNGQLQFNNSGAFGGVGSPTLPNLSTTGATVTSLPTSGWTIVNGALLNDFSIGMTGVTIPDSGSLNWRFIKRTISVPYTIIALIDFSDLGAENVTSQTGGLYITDGTKLEGIEMLAQTNSGLKLRVETMTNVTTDSATVAGPTAGIVGTLIALKISNNSTNRVFSYWSNGAWVTFLTEASGTFLTENAAGPGGVCVVNLGRSIELRLLYWSVT